MRVIKCHHVQVPSGKILPTATMFDWRKPAGFEQWTSELPGAPVSDGHRMTADNGFIAAACHAYSDHLPLVINPWHVWIVILQSISKYVNEHSEQVRHLIVAHKSKKEINVCAGSIVGGITGNFEAMCRDCKLELGVNLSLNTPNDIVARTVMHLAALDTVKAYFKYGFSLCCGVPEYHVEGTHEDWQQLIDRVQPFAQLGPEVSDWVAQLVPVLQQIQTSEDPNFWARCCTLTQVGSGGGQNIDGWILAFYLYSNNEFLEWKAPDPQLADQVTTIYKAKKDIEDQFAMLCEAKKKTEDQAIKESMSALRTKHRQICNQLQQCMGTRVSTDDLMQTALSRVPFTVTDVDGTEYDVEIHGGLVGATQDASTGAVRPLPGYVVWRKLKQ